MIESNMTSFKDRFQERLAQIENLPTLPAVVFDVGNALEDENNGAEEVSLIIEEDPSITANILHVVNSVYYGATSGTISSVQDAVARLGFGETRRLIMTLGVLRSFAGFGKGLDAALFWKHSLLTGFAAKRLHAFSQPGVQFSASEANVAGLLHDIGKLIMDQHFPEEFSLVQDTAEELQRPVYEVEERALGMDHGEIGGTVLQAWNLPSSVVEAVRWHHKIGCCPDENRPLAEAVHLADIVCNALAVDGAKQDALDNLVAPKLEKLKLSTDHMQELIEQIATEAESCSVLLSIL